MDKAIREAEFVLERIDSKWPPDETHITTGGVRRCRNYSDGDFAQRHRTARRIASVNDLPATRLLFPEPMLSLPWLQPA